ncbi:hypothetical protein FCV25MIE_17033 [Fagus crenata]
MSTNNTLALNNASNVPSDAVKSAEKKLVRIEAYVSLVAILLAFLVVLGSHRRRNSNVVLKQFIWVAYVSCTYLIGYTIGLMQAASFHNELFAFWGAFLLTFFGSADCITAYSPEDNENRKRTEEKGAALKSASRDGLKRSTRPIADFMTYEHTLRNNDGVEAKTMKGYNYLLVGEKIPEVCPPDYNKMTLDTTPRDVITIDKIWQCKGDLLGSGDRDGRLKDICLSFAMYRILLCRFAGYSLFESPESKEKCKQLVLDGLILKEGGDGEVDHERVFKVIEDELRFVYDSLYTKYPIIFARGLFLRSIQFISVIFGCWIMVNIFKDYRAPSGHLKLVTVGGRDIDILVTGIGIAIIIFVEFVQYLVFNCSAWAKVKWVCIYVQNPSWHTNGCREKFIQFACSGKWYKWFKWFNPWERKLRQYSLLHSFNHNPCILLYNSWTSNYIDKHRKGQKESKRIKLPEEVKEAVILSLRNNGLHLSNGEVSLRQNGVANLSWACKLESPTHVIMVFHIVTNLFEINDIQSTTRERRHFIVATTLSKYCAYLVAFAPRLVTHHADFPEVIFDQVVNEARHFLRNCNSPEEKLTRMKELYASRDQEEIISKGSIFRRAAILVNNLEEDPKIWKILADFWAEMMLFVTPSNDVKAHAEHLAVGGEFVTHLWALLTHAGILNQDSIQDVLPQESSTQDASAHSREFPTQDASAHSREFSARDVSSPEIQGFPAQDASIHSQEIQEVPTQDASAHS